MKKKDLLWYLSCGTFVLFSVLGVTGLINWFILPKGCETGGGFFLYLRHFLREVHEWAGLLFLIFVAVHLWMHKDYILNNWKNYFGKNA